MNEKKEVFSVIAIRVCDEILGPIERDRTTLDALEVARVLTTQGPDRQRLDEIEKQMATIWHDRASEAEADVVFDTGVESDDNAYLAVWNTKRWHSPRSS